MLELSLLLVKETYTFMLRGNNLLVKETYTFMLHGNNLFILLLLLDVV